MTKGTLVQRPVYLPDLSGTRPDRGVGRRLPEELPSWKRDLALGRRTGRDESLWERGKRSEKISDEGSNPCQVTKGDVNLSLGRRTRNTPGHTKLGSDREGGGRGREQVRGGWCNRKTSVRVVGVWGEFRGVNDDTEDELLEKGVYSPRRSFTLDIPVFGKENRLSVNVRFTESCHGRTVYHPLPIYL